MNQMLAITLQHEHLGSTVTFLFDGKTVSGRLDGFYKGLNSCMVIVNDCRVRGVPSGTVIELEPRDLTVETRTETKVAT